jgi:hypothetical protein
MPRFGDIRPPKYPTEVDYRVTKVIPYKHIETKLSKRPMESTTFSNSDRSEPGRFGSGLRRKWLLTAALFAAFSTAMGSAQVIPGLVMRSDTSVYVTMPFNVTPNFAPYDSNVLFGYSLGGYYQTRHILGAEIRGSIQRRGNAQHQESALAGPRAAFHFGKFTPYTSFLIGAGNGWRFAEQPPAGTKPPKPIEGMGAQWTMVGGVDVHLTRNFALRMGEVSYTKLYLKNWNLSPVNLTGGVIWRLR